MKKGIIIVLLSVILSLIVVFVYNKITAPNVAYVDLGKLYSEFSLKKELEQKYKQTSELRKNILDSLRLQIQIKSKNSALKKNEKDQAELNLLKEQYYYKEQQFTEDNRVLSEKYNEQVLNQMNQYVMDFSKDKAYDFVFGANSSGSLMYASSAYDITEQVTNYINEKYQGVKK
ncbi:MAG: hypothetical protein A2275_14870 [Bacteroidetes bacterium RIFOXYA12_FULL_35_11]|nr:MAG: hypothetical protein A2275_14870 [Bacteroidetes bacterium RIFOXYA12_FULL_35_11]OFY93346.1 MAG: hypothetical protein A2309_05960 [Bacteroidetes bacterium RIFOXYB2_FULL_35_7]OFY95876.1 MAG: hypothetical protein A2491_19545 [Bacteroidetes bacterium RIFOXYC12_FULL_35_7]HBX50424.1 hypothetical protein [Bacteroidales bacterium]